MKIHIIGCGGSGKTYLAKALSKKYNIPYFDLDDIQWDNTANGYGVKMPVGKRTELLNNILNNENWIIEGVYYAWVGKCFEDADKIYVLDIPKRIYTYRIIKRAIKRKFGLEKGKKETLKSVCNLLKWTDTFQKKNMVEIRKIVSAYLDKTVWLKTSQEIQEAINEKQTSMLIPSDKKNYSDVYTTLGELALEGRRFWRFSQSKPGRSCELHKPIQYIPGQIACAQDKEKLLSFVAQENIASVFMYGDMLTELNFDLNDEKFQQIKNCTVKRINNSFCEFECEKLLPLKNYSLQNLENVKLFLELIPKEASLIPLATFKIRGSYYWERLDSYGYHDSAEVIRRISHIIEKHPDLNSEEALNIYEEFIKEKNL